MAIADHELVSIQTKATLEVAKQRGVKLGRSENLPADAGQRSTESKRQSAIADYKQVTGYNRTLRGQGLSYDHIAGRLNSDGFITRQGKPFQAMTVYRIVKRNGGGD
jgi:hypothetical protein